MKWIWYILSALEEEPAWLSIMRIMMGITGTTACCIAIYFARRGNVTENEVWLVVGMLGVAVTGKVGQKIFEKK